MASLKSLLSKAHKLGYIAFNPGAALEVGTVKNTIGERLLSEEQVQRMLDLETNKRNYAILRMLYAAALQCDELCALHGPMCNRVTLRPFCTSTARDKRHAMY